MREPLRKSEVRKLESLGKRREALLANETERAGGAHGVSLKQTLGPSNSRTSTGKLGGCASVVGWRALQSCWR
jgi:hypothetical protein